MSIDSRSRYLDTYGQVRSALPGAGAPWLAHWRQSALDWFAEHGLPTLRDEDWKYTGVAPVERRQFQLASGATSAPQWQEDAWSLGLPVHRLVFVDGRYAPALSSLQPLQPGVRLGSLAQVLEERPGDLQRCLGTAAPFDAHGFAALNAAFTADGAYLHVPAGVALGAPLLLVFLASGQAEVMSFPRNLLVLEEGARATVIETYQGPDNAAYLTVPVTEIFAGPGADIEHYKLQQEGAGAFHVGGVHVRQQADSRLLSSSIALGAWLSRTDIHTRLEADGGRCDLDGLYLGQGRQHVDHHTRIDHAKPSCTSREFYKGVLDGAARAVFGGRIVVHPDAQHTDAQQSNRNLLLSEDAEVDTKPQLEIYADDVKCSHGATVGQIEPEQLFYLRSRGLADREARNLLTYAFAREVIERVRLAPLRSAFESKLLARLPVAGMPREMTP